MKTRTHTFLTPMSPDGTPGEVREIQVSDDAPQFLAPVSYNEDAAAPDLKKLRRDLHETQIALAHAKARRATPAEIAKLETAFEAAKTAAGAAHRDQQRARIQQRTGTDYGAPSPFSRQQLATDSRQFAEVVSYVDTESASNVDEGDYADDLSDDELEAAIKKAVDDLKKAQSAGRPWSEILRLEAALKVLRDQLPNPSAPPAVTTTAPPRVKKIERPGPTQSTGQSAAPATPPAPAVPKKLSRKEGWKKHLADLDERLKKRALAAVYTPSGATASPAKSSA